MTNHRVTQRATNSGRLALALALALFGAACSDGSDPNAPTPESPGTLTVDWFTPNNVEGAVRLVLEGPGIASITTAQADGTLFARSEGERHSIAVIGSAGTGGLLRFDVPDTGRVDRYRVTLVEVADAETSALRDDLGDYRISVEKH